MGKGSGRRPLLISEQELIDRWDTIFKQKPHEGQGPETQPGPASRKITGATLLARPSISIASSRISHWAR